MFFPCLESLKARLFFYCLICIDIYRQTGKRRHLREAKKLSNKLGALVKRGFIKLLHKYQILDAELRSLGKNSDAGSILQFYNTAIASSAKSGYLQDAALANLLCAQFCMTARDGHLKQTANLYFHKSVELFCSWGALEVAKSIKLRYPEYF
mmetsp:Transcript_17665/g.30868  ORF Transcript_17665/g.30868 Transcript_17665/m.30868 type:complete len:152 (+) Transcript_17665:2628-3083(+)